MPRASRPRWRPRPQPQQSGPIAVYGATGYTGRLVAAELRRRGADFVLAGRSAAKLEIVAEDIGGASRSGRRHSTTRRRCATCSALRGRDRLRRAVPLHGEPVLAAAVETGTHYLDTTGEQPFIRTVFEVYGRARPARRRRAGPGDGLRLRARRHDRGADRRGNGAAGRGDARLRGRGFGATRGTALSALGMMGGGDVEWRDGGLPSAPRRVGARELRVPGPDRPPADDALPGRRAHHRAAPRPDADACGRC